jgi:hypothetical protein
MIQTSGLANELTNYAPLGQSEACILSARNIFCLVCLRMPSLSSLCDTSAIRHGSSYVANTDRL